MSKFNKLVELAKESIEKYIIEDVGKCLCVFLPTKTEDLILGLGTDWYYNILKSAGYSQKTIERKVDNIDFDKLANALDDWYKTELYPKLYNRFQNEGRDIEDELNWFIKTEYNNRFN